MEIAVLHSPTAGDRTLSRRKLCSLLRTAGYRPKYFSLKKSVWKKENALRGVELVVVAGGDGSLRRAILYLHDRGLPLALLPLGTANNICTSLGITGSPKQIIASWAKADRRRLDLGVAKGPWGEQLFVESVGVGLIGRAITIMAAVGDATEHRLERREDRVYRDASVVLALTYELHPVTIALSLNGGAAKSDDYLLLEVMNISRVGPGLEIAPEANASDGWLNLVSATIRERGKLKGAIASSIVPHHAGGSLTRRRVRSVRIDLKDGEFRFDDQIAINLRDHSQRRPKKVRVEISIRPKAFEIIFPRLA
jgi:diacylglycerol kinase (ATP)